MNSGEHILFFLHRFIIRNGYLLPIYTKRNGIRMADEIVRREINTEKVKIL